MLDVGEIVIEGLRVDALVGAYDFEREAKQPLYFDLVLSYYANAPASSDKLCDAIDYALVVAVLRGFVQSRSDQLLEKLAVDCCDFLAKQFRLVKICLTVNKPMAAEALGCATVGVRLERKYPLDGHAWLLLLGSNLHSDQVLNQAVGELAQLGHVELLGAIQRLPPDKGNVAWYYNALASLRCDLPAAELRATLRDIEVKLGRDRTAGNVVAIDIDILARFENGWVADEHAKRAGKLDDWPTASIRPDVAFGVKAVCIKGGLNQ